MQNLGPGLHGSTFGGNPLACAAALAPWRSSQKRSLPEQAAEKGAYLMESCAHIDSPA